jgi:cellulose synthase/poly-beta-1,6-N-acetylglucosamine synthase-like glycosyltransferase
MQIYDDKGLVFLGLVALILAFLVRQPLSRRFDDSDKGAGPIVKIPPYRKHSLVTDGAFLAVAALVGLAVLGIGSTAISQAYRNLVVFTLSIAVRDPGAVQAYTSRLLPLLPVTVLGFLLALAVVLPATPGRRLMILLHMPLFLALSVITDSAIVLAGIASGLPLGPVPLISMFLQYTVAFMMLLRLYFTSLQLPRVTQVPVRGRWRWRDNVVMALCLIASAGIVGALAALLMTATGEDPLIDFIVIISIRTGIIEVLSVLLGLIKLAGYRVQPGPERPALEVIAPAFNEAPVIERMLQSIDRAAGVYGGPVRVIICDDGSTDATRELAAAAMASFSYATGEVIYGNHGGKARALNMALAKCTSDYVYRVDSDCALDPNAFIYSIPHFLHDPRVGLVGAFTVPKEPYTTWIDRMRALEQILAFGFLRPTLAQVDAIPCVPGTFCAFRRAAAIAIGGFLDGMFGEDVDFTCAIARLGWRAEIDPRVVSYEDVPVNVAGLRLQRVRWGLGGFMSFARFTPFGNKAPGPRFWFQLPKANLGRLFIPPHFFLIIVTIEFSFADPGIRHNILKFFIALFLTQVPGTIPRLCAMLYYRRLGLLPWLVLWLPFALLKRFYLLEAVLSISTRPVLPPIAIRARYPTWRAMLRHAPPPVQSQPWVPRDRDPAGAA